ncbi:MAG: ATP-binding protein [Albidovulum sp.]|nr:ATP-binding protein [Albidovulum sp.]
MALVELIKNAYDADAGSVDVEFDGFAEDMTTQPGSRIVVRDDGCDMTPETVKTVWMNPATPTKFLAKKGESGGRQRETG